MTLPRDYIRRCASSYAEKVAFIEGERQRTWQEIHSRSERLAQALQALGLAKGNVVAVLAHDHIEVIEHWFACLKTGMVRTGINWRYGPEAMLHIIRDSDAKAILVQAKCLGSLAEHTPALAAEGRLLIGFGGDHDLPFDYETLIAGADGNPTTPDLAVDDRCALLYTTGSTGMPKGVIWNQRQLVSALCHMSLAKGLRHEDVWGEPAPMPGYPIIAATLGIVNGMTTVLSNGDFSADGFLRAVQRNAMTCAILIPTMMQRIAAEIRRGSYDTSSLRFIVWGSAPAAPALLKDFASAIGCGLQTVYGATEGGWWTWMGESDYRRALTDRPEWLASSGAPLLHTELQICDDDGRVLPPGETGEVWVRGPAITAGYHQLPDENKATFTDGWYKTGDIGRIGNEGHLYLLDRKRFKIISGGYNVYPATVESILAEHPSVQEAAVVGAPHPDWGEAVVAVVVVKGNRHIEERELIEFCRPKLGRWEVPKFVDFVSALPKGATGKIQKQAVREWYRQGLRPCPWNTPAANTEASAGPHG